MCKSIQHCGKAQIMKSFFITALAAAGAVSVSAINILLSNDDGFASAQLVETFRLLKANGHNVVAVASGRSGLYAVTDLAKHRSRQRVWSRRKISIHEQSQPDSRLGIWHCQGRCPFFGSIAYRPRYLVL